MSFGKPDIAQPSAVDEVVDVIQPCEHQAPGCGEMQCPIFAKLEAVWVVEHANVGLPVDPADNSGDIERHAADS